MELYEEKVLPSVYREEFTIGSIDIRLASTNTLSKVEVIDRISKKIH